MTEISIVEDKAVSLTADEEDDKKHFERDLFGEGEEPLSENQYRAIKRIVDERDELEAQRDEQKAIAALWERLHGESIEARWERKHRW